MKRAHLRLGKGGVSIEASAVTIDSEQLICSVRLRSSEALSDCSDAGEICVQETKKPTSLPPLRIPRLSKTIVTKKGRVPRISGDTEDFVAPMDEDESFPVSAPAHRRSTASVPADEPLVIPSLEKKSSVSTALEKKPSTPPSPRRKRAGASVSAKKPSVVSMLLEKRSSRSVPAEELPAVSTPSKKSSHTSVPTEERSTVSVLLERRLADSIPEEEPSMPSVQQEDRAQAAPRPQQPVELVKRINSGAGNVQDRPPGMEVKPAKVPPPSPKLLKVIRRRGEQAPKVFETAASRFPEAMLKGLKVNLEEDIESSPD